MTTFKAGRVQVSMSLLADLLNLPEGSKIVRVSDAKASQFRTFEIIVEHPSLPEVAEGEVIPEVGFVVDREVKRGSFHVTKE